MFSKKYAGYLCGAFAAITYGMNPLFGLPLYTKGITTGSLLFYRFTIASVLLAAFMLFCKISFRIGRRHVLPLVFGGVLLALSCLFLFLSFHLLDAGIAATILFVYPVMVALLMFICFREKPSIRSISAMSATLGGIILLNGCGGKFSFAGLIYVLLSALTYAVYMILVKKSSLQELAPETLTLYAMLTGLPVFVIALHGGTELQMLPNAFSWGCAVGLAIFPSLLSFLLMAKAIQYIGPTFTAIIGALEPVTALTIGVIVFGEVLSVRAFCGIIVILGAVTWLVTGEHGSHSTAG